MDDKTQKSLQSLLTKNLQKVRKDIKQDTKSQINQSLQKAREEIKQDTKTQINQSLQQAREEIKQDTKSQIDQGFKEIHETLEQDMVRVFNQGFEQIVVPELEEIRGDIKRIDVRLERVENKLDVLADKNSDHEIRIKRLEKKPSAVLAA